jgi:hypothetical protein
MLPMIQRFLLLSFLLVVLVGLVSCGEEPQPTPTPTETALPATSTPVPPTPTPTAPAASSPLEPGPAVVAPASPLTTTTVATTTGSAGAAQQTSGECAIQPDLDLAGYQDLEQQMGCALATAQFEPVAINEFGPGPEVDRFMLWFSTELQIYVLLPDGRWQVYPDTWTEDQPTFPCGNPLGEEEPESPPLPRRGFGKLWCEEQGLQNILGTIPREERLCQHTVVQPFERGRLLACYEDATIRYIRLLEGGTWDTVLVR